MEQELKKQIADLNEEKTKLEAKLNAEISSKVEKITKLENDLNQMKNNHDEVNNQLVKLNKKLNNIQLSLEIQNQPDQIESKIENLKKTIEERDETIRTLKNGVYEKKKVKELKILIKEIKDLFGKCQDKSSLYNIVIQTAPEFYPKSDFEIRSDGNELFLNGDGYLRTKGDIYKWSETVNNKGIFSIIGGYQTGKTFLLSKISSENLGYGKKFSTKSISFKEIELQSLNFISIDTPGFFKPKKLDLEEYDKKTEDLFIRKLATQLSDIIIYVVSNYSYNDQKILKTFRTCPLYKKKKIIIVHNFKEAFNICDINYFWEQQVIKIHMKDDYELGIQKKKVEIIHDGKPLTEMVFILKENKIKRQKQFTHFCLASEYCEYGKNYNKFVVKAIIDLIANHFENSSNLIKGKAFQAIQETISEYVGSEVNIMENTSEGPEDGNYKFSFNDNIDLKNIKLRIKDSLKKTNSRYKNSNARPTEEGYLIDVQLPGIPYSDINIECSNFNTTILVSKHPSKKHYLQTYSCESKSESNDLYEFEIPKNFNHIQPKATYRDGILTLKYQEQNKTIIRVDKEDYSES